MMVSTLNLVLRPVNPIFRRSKLSNSIIEFHFPKQSIECIAIIRCYQIGWLFPPLLEKDKILSRCFVDDDNSFYVFNLFRLFDFILYIWETDKFLLNVTHAPEKNVFRSCKLKYKLWIVRYDESFVIWFRFSRR